MHGIGCAVARRSAGPLRLRPAPAAAGHLAVPRKNYIDHGVTDQSSILRFIEDTNEGPIVGEWLRSLPRDCGLDVGSGTGPYGQDLLRGGRLALKGLPGSTRRTQVGGRKRKPRWVSEGSTHQFCCLVDPDGTAQGKRDAVHLSSTHQC
jgi:hypothetical protein